MTSRPAHGPPDVTARGLGDWQTTEWLCQQVFDVLVRRGVRCTRVLEPTCGAGGFLRAALDAYPTLDEIVGLEIQDDHLREAHRLTKDERLRLANADVFKTNLQSDIRWETTGPLLVVGNPPWVTNAELGSLGGRNLPEKSNLRGLNGLDAMTGASNFDIAEHITLKVLSELGPEEPTLAFLVKTSVARSVLKLSHQLKRPVQRASIHRFDASEAFGAAVDACLLVMEMGGADILEEVPVFGSLTDDRPSRTLGFSNSELIADMRAYERSRHLDGASMLTWRQGVKHDASRVMELERAADGALRNKLGEVVDVEDDYVYPLLKATQLHRGETSHTPRWVIVTQRSLQDDTRALRRDAPLLWAYLSSHRDVLDARKSSVYSGKPPFVMFGVGGYSFADHKVAVSGLHKTPRFRILRPLAGKPVMVDDTSYLLPCANARQAAVVKAILDSAAVRYLLRALVFSDSKRPVTKKLLQRIDLAAALDGEEAPAVLREANRILDQELTSTGEAIEITDASLTMLAI